mmetsp:Transcript_42820/g.100339  ORF Transcript_42820/g.100339 Transcript_42820/m.100339 type:complete len:237 (+) Transcript_42820:300-1010(+)
MRVEDILPCNPCMSSTRLSALMGLLALMVSNESVAVDLGCVLDGSVKLDRHRSASIGVIDSNAIMGRSGKVCLATRGVEENALNALFDACDAEDVAGGRAGQAALAFLFSSHSVVRLKVVNCHAAKFGGRRLGQDFGAAELEHRVQGLMPKRPKTDLGRRMRRRDSFDPDQDRNGSGSNVVKGAVKRRRSVCAKQPLLESGEVVHDGDVVQERLIIVERLPQSVDIVGIVGAKVGR